jgi:hypothetical protein
MLRCAYLVHSLGDTRQLEEGASGIDDVRWPRTAAQLRRRTACAAESERVELLLASRDGEISTNDLHRLSRLSRNRRRKGARREGSRTTEVGEDCPGTKVTRPQLVQHLVTWQFLVVIGVIGVTNDITFGCSCTVCRSQKGTELLWMLWMRKIVEIMFFYVH